MPGFSRLEQAALATLVGQHRRKVDLEKMKSTPYMRKKVLIRLCVLLRLAVLLHRPRTSRVDLTVRCEVSGKSISLLFPENWLHSHPLTGADLHQEHRYLKDAGFQLEVRS